MFSALSILLFAAATALAQDIPLLEGCSETDRVLAKVRRNDPVEVHSAVAGNAKTCYSITATISGQQLRGYVLGEDLPAIAALERERKAAKFLMPEPPPKPPADPNAAEPPKPQVVFENFPGRDVLNRPFNLDRLRARAIIVHFWSYTDKVAHDDVEQNIGALYEKYHEQGLAVVGITLDRDIPRFIEFINTHEVEWPQFPDTSGRLAKRYGVGRSKILLLDGQRKVIADNLRGTDLELAVQQAIRRK